MLRRSFVALSGAAFAQQRPMPRVAFIGVGDRGTGLLKNLLFQSDVEIPAICDINPANLKRAQDLVQKSRVQRPEGFSKGPEDYRRMLARTDFNAVIIATPQELHARMSLDALKAGKFTGCEVPACTTLEECWDLVKTARATKSGYM